MTDKINIALVLAIAAITLFVGFQVIGSLSDQSRIAVEESSEWCADRGGEILNSHTVGEHGGMHCQWGDGSMIHMKDVEGVGPDQSGNSWGLVGLAIPVALVLIIVGMYPYLPRTA